MGGAVLVARQGPRRQKPANDQKHLHRQAGVVVQPANRTGGAEVNHIRHRAIGRQVVPDDQRAGRPLERVNAVGVNLTRRARNSLSWQNA